MDASKTYVLLFELFEMSWTPASFILCLWIVLFDELFISPQSSKYCSLNTSFSTSWSFPVSISYIFGCTSTNSTQHSSTSLALFWVLRHSDIPVHFSINSLILLILALICPILLPNLFSSWFPGIMC